MAYLSKIKNLYQDTDVLMLRECYSLEKIHGTNAKLHWNHGLLDLYPGGESVDNFKTCFDVDAITERFRKLNYFDVVVYGEAYGGSQQKQAHRYGPTLKFIAFDVVVDDHFLCVPDAEDVCKQLGLEFVHYVKGPATLEFLNFQRDQPSIQAARNGVMEPKTREGIIIRPLMELTKNDGRRLIAKHKTDEFKETKTSRSINPEKIKAMSDANAAAEEWVTENRMDHIIDKLSAGGNELTIEHTKAVIVTMIEDVKAESEGEIEWSQAVSSAIGKAAAQMFKKRVSKIPLT